MTTESRGNFIKEIEDFISSIEPVTKTRSQSMLLFQNLVNKECERKGFIKTGFANLPIVQQEIVYRLANGAELKVKTWNPK